MALSSLALLVLLTPQLTQEPLIDLEQALGEANFVVEGEWIEERVLPPIFLDLDPAPVFAIRVDSWLYGTDREDVIYIRRPRDDSIQGPAKTGERAIFLLKEMLRYRFDVEQGNNEMPTRLFEQVPEQCIPMLNTPQGSLPDLSAFGVPFHLSEPPPMCRGAALRAWIKSALNASAPRIRVGPVIRMIGRTSFELLPDGSWKFHGGFNRNQKTPPPKRRGSIDQDSFAAILDVVDPKYFFTLPKDVGTDRAPCFDWLPFEVRTSWGVHEVRLFDTIRTPQERKADAHCKRIFEALPIDPEWWGVPRTYFLPE